LFENRYKSTNQRKQFVRYIVDNLNQVGSELILLFIANEL
jgi:hypothetical protein